MVTIKRKWTPHPMQRAVMEDDARFRIIAAGRRFGKTEMAQHIAIEYGWQNPGTEVWWVSPTYNDANELGFDGIQEKIPDSEIEDVKRSAPRHIKIRNGTTFSFRSGERIDSLRGRGLDEVVIDEAGSVPDRAWQEELRPALSDTLGGMVAIGTPRGRNWFHDYFQRGQDDAHTDTHSWQASSYENPHWPDSEVEDARAELPERVFRQEYLAEFIDDEGAVFGDVRGRNVAEYTLPREPHQVEPPFTIGVDLGRKQNFTGIVVVDGSGFVVSVDRDRGGTWQGVKASVKAAASSFAPATVYLDATRDNKVVEDIQNELSVGVEPVSFTAKKKARLIENLAARLEMGDLFLPRDGEASRALLSELEAFEYTTTPSGNIQYQAAAGNHDDLVDALALAAQKPNVSESVW